jgi:hypothetical protein
VSDVFTRFKMRRGTAANWTSVNPTLLDGEPGLETDTLKVKYGDGVTAWTGLPYASGPGGTGTVTSVDASGGTTGFTFTGGPITTGGTLILGGTLAVANGGTGATTASAARAALGVAIGSDVEAHDADLTAIAAIAGTSGLLRKTAANTWSLDTSAYLTANQLVTLSGDVSGAGATAITTTIGANKVTRAMLSATAGATLLGATGAGNVADLTAAQAKTFLAIASGDVSGLGTAAMQNTGTSGANVPLLNGANTVSGVQTFTANPSITNATSASLTTTSGSYSTSVATTSGGESQFTSNGVVMYFTLDGPVNFRTSLGVTGVSFDSGGALHTTAYIATPELYLNTTGGAVGIVAGSTVTTNRTLTINTGDANRALTLAADATISGTNTGDQTITLTGDVTGTGTGSFATSIGSGKVTLAMQANMATASVVYRKTAGSGAPEVQTLATLKTDLGLTGTNSGDQTITLTGDVTGSGTGSFATTVANIPSAATAVTQAANDSSTKVATTAFVTTADNLKAPLASPTFTGTVTLPADQYVYSSDGNARLYFTGGAQSTYRSADGRHFFTDSVGTPTLSLANAGNGTFTGTVSATNITSAGNVTGNAATATKFATARTLGITGDVTWTSPSFDGSGNVTAAATINSIPSGATAVTQAAGDNSTKVATTAYAIAAAPNASYRSILDVTASHTAAKVAGTYGMGQGDPLAVSGTGTLYPLNLIYIAAADYPTVNGLAAKLRIRAQLYVNDVAPTGNFTFGLYPVTRPGTSGGAGLVIYTLGTVVSGSTVLFTAPAADSSNVGVSTDFALPADGHYCIGVVTSATVATSSHLHLSALLQMRNA